MKFRANRTDWTYFNKQYSSQGVCESHNMELNNIKMMKNVQQFDFY